GEMIYQECMFFCSSRRRHTRFSRDWSSDVCSSDLLKGSNKMVVWIIILFTIFFILFIYQKVEVKKAERKFPPTGEFVTVDGCRRSEERRVGKECRARWSW